jgi:Tfp pilus assembly protein PilF
MIATLIKYKHFISVVIISLTAIICYSNIFDVPFQFDDRANIIENPIIKDLRHFIHPSEANLYAGSFQHNVFVKRFVGHLSFALNYKLHAFDVRGYHAVNLIIHIINGALLYLLVILTFRTPFMECSPFREHSGLIALFSALLFVSHPIQTQAVTYIVQRLASLATLFYILSLVLYIKARLKTELHSSRIVKKKHHSREIGGDKISAFLLYFSSVVFSMLAMKTKEIAFTLPLAMALYELMFFRGKAGMRLLRLVPFLLTLLIIPLTYIGLYSDMEKPIEEIMADTDQATTIQKLSRVDYLLTQFRITVTYLRLLVLPVGQNLDYDYPVYNSFFAPPVLMSFLFLLTFFGLGVYLYYRSRTTHHSLRLVSFGILWFFISLSVESSIIPLHVIWEHRVYLPSAGFFTSIVTAAFLLLEMQKNRTSKKAVAVIFALVLVVLLSATYSRNTAWQSKSSLWKDVISKSDQSVRGYNNLGNAYMSEGMVDKAIQQYLLALKARPWTKPNPRYYAEIYYNLAHAYENRGLLDKAIEHYRKSLSIDFNNLDTYNNLGLVYLSKGLTDKAITYFQSAIELDPDYAEAHFNIGEAYFSMGWLDKSIEHYEAFLKLRPNYKESHYNLGLAYKEKGLAEKAEEHFKKAAVLKDN